MDNADIRTAYDAAAPAYATGRVKFFQPVAARLVETAGIRRGDHVLDIGCGTGATLIAAGEATGPEGRVTGIDPSQRMRIRARQAALDHGFRSGQVHVWAENADADHLPWITPRFDVITASMVVFLLPDLPASLARWRMILRPGGTLACSWRTAGDPRWAAAIAAVDAHLPPGVPSWEAHVTGLPFSDPVRMLHLAEAAGYEDVRVLVCPLVMRFSDPAEWWMAAWSSGYRTAWQHIPVAERDRARGDALAALEPHREADGSISRIQPIAYLTARRP